MKSNNVKLTFDAAQLRAFVAISDEQTGPCLHSDLVNKGTKFADEKTDVNVWNLKLVNKEALWERNEWVLNQMVMSSANYWRQWRCNNIETRAMLTIRVGAI